MVKLRSRKVLEIIFLTSVAVVLIIKILSPMIPEKMPLSLDERLEIALDNAQIKLSKTINYLKQVSNKEKLYPSLTYNKFIDTKRTKIPNGAWMTGKSNFWAAGAFPAILWKMEQLETDPTQQKFWKNKAQQWSESLRLITQKNQTKDITINNLFVFQPWYENASGTEKTEQLKTIFQGAELLAEPFDGEKGSFHSKIGAYGYEREASRTDKETHWQAFIDHSINVEQLLWAAAHNPNAQEAQKWRNIAIQHLKTIGNTFTNDSGELKTWQRGYFDYNPNSSDYGKFLFAEGKQGWKDDSGWSRGQAWLIYAASVTYKYTQESEFLHLAKNSINYFLNHLPDRFPGKLRRVGDFIPPWDFDYAIQVDPNTEKDSSAATIAISGILKLITVLPNSDPDQQRYLEDVAKILFNLTSSEYLTPKNGREMNILKHGCYHHPQAIQPSSACDNGLIWGDYFFLDALVTYRNLLIPN